MGRCNIFQQRERRFRFTIRANEEDINGEFFIAKKSELPKLSFPKRSSELDHDWYEFHSLIPTLEQENDRLNRDILEMLETIKQASVI